MTCPLCRDSGRMTFTLPYEIGGVTGVYVRATTCPHVKAVPEKLIRHMTFDGSHCECCECHQQHSSKGVRQ